MSIDLPRACVRLTDMSDSHDKARPEHIGHKTRKGISWSFAGAVTTNGMRFVVLTVLGRALTSADFGVVAAAVSVNVIVYGIRDLGIGQALVQRKQLEPAHISTAFAVAVYLGLALSALLFFGAPLIADFYGIRESVDVIRVLAFVFFALRSVSTTSRMLCQRAMNFRLIAIVDATAFTIGSAISIACALAGAGPWALVAGYLVEELISTALYLIKRPPRFSLAVNLARLRELLDFGIGQSVTQSTNVVATYGDNFVVGHALGAASLGYYSRAYDLIKFPSMVFDAIVGNVLFPAFSRLQDDRQGLAASFRRVAFVNALVLLPASALIIVAAPEAIRVLMGPGWADVVLPFRILSFTILLRTNLKLGGILAQAAGAVNAVAIAYAVYMIVVVGGALITIRWGIGGVAVSTALAITSVSTHCCLLAIRVSGLSIRGFLRAHVPGLVLASGVTAATWPLAEVLRAHGAPFTLVLVAAIGAAGAVTLAGIAVWLRTGRGDFAWLAEELNRIRRRRAARDRV
ncbi:MAG TPA: lipopolysaccharide biosynthesis protein [Kofleriaceae bacterium]|nr:lipopolysaccharide biosynthesis protein [Kofleriaceae bacterium]